MSFTAPEPGIIYLYDWEKHRVVASALLGQGDTYSVGESGVVWERPPATRTTFGVLFADLIVYFVPLRDLKLGKPWDGQSAPQASG